MVVVANAFNRVSRLSDLPKKWMTRLPLRKERVAVIRMKNVEIFIPLAVELGAPPMNMRSSINTVVPAVKAPMSSVLNPAVLGVTP